MKKVTQIKNIFEIADKYSTFFFDMEGVFWNGNKQVPQAALAFDKLKALKKNIFFLTNNSSRSRDTYVKRLSDFGVNTQRENVFSSASLAAYYIKKKYPNVKKCFVVGMKGIIDELEQQNIKYIWAHQYNENKPMTAHDFAQIKLDQDVSAVIVGIDYCFNYKKLVYANLYIQNGAIFIAAALNGSTKVSGKKMPAGGAIVQALKFITDKEPIQLGKPNPFGINLICEQYKIQKQQAVMIGDSINSDILVAKNAEIDSILTLSGNTSLEQLQHNIQNEGNIVPTYYIESLQ